MWIVGADPDGMSMSAGVMDTLLPTAKTCCVATGNASPGDRLRCGGALQGAAVNPAAEPAAALGVDQIKAEAPEGAAKAVGAVGGGGPWPGLLSIVTPKG
jgi:hypothetical protein